jgi:hypothetical protein
MSGWRWDLDDENYFGEPQPLDKAEKWWRPDDRYHIAWAAEEAAEVFHSEHDGWEAQWPVIFRIYPPGSDTFVRVEVEREAVPAFDGHILDGTP